jgi:uncharacterized OB-fold protein
MPEALPVPVVKCSACGALDPGPREVCPKCHKPTLVASSAPGTGKLVSWTMIRRPPAQYREDGQYAVAVVRLDAGVQVTGRLKDPSEDVKPGARVKAVAPMRNTVLFEVVNGER